MDVLVCFEHGQVVKIVPDPNTSYYEVRDDINHATKIMSDGVRYDLTDEKSIRSIKVPAYTYSHENSHANDLGVTGYLEYVLRMHSGWLWNNGDYNLSNVCLGKACQLMLYSTIDWQRKDYYRIVNQNIELGRFKKAKEWKDWIERNTKSVDDIAIDAYKRTLDSCKFLETDLVETGGELSCCGTCAKYRNRIFSLTGKDIRFPRFPKDFHFGCISVSPFVYGVHEPVFPQKHYILHSWRPFKDDRTQEEKDNYRERMERISKMENSEHFPNLGHIIYYWFKPKFPDDFPKSLSGFSRMRNSNSKNYQKLIRKIESAGYKIPESLEEVAQWDEDSN